MRCVEDCVEVCFEDAEGGWAGWVGRVGGGGEEGVGGRDAGVGDYVVDGAGGGGCGGEVEEGVLGGVGGYVGWEEGGAVLLGWALGWVGMGEGGRGQAGVPGEFARECFAVGDVGVAEVYVHAGGR